MNPTSPRIDEIFWEAVRLAPGTERESYLDRACGSDPELRQKLARLVQVQPEVEAFLEQPLAAAADIATATEPGERLGTVIGPYKVLEQLGEGGMGLVYVAEQQQPVRRKVALKIIKPGMDTRQVVARFEAERQALALMDHPHIAKVFDGGATTEGRPYFVMELVRGTPITDHCDQFRLPTRQRLELFLDVCHAVQHAHQKGVIHRDLKPSNVLVEVHDVRPVVKVIDFGIAKATGQQLTDKTVYTGASQLVGTPLYMSPEQAGLSSLDVDTRSDVYSLGVLLYELLSGTTPFDAETLKKAGYDEIRRIIREDEPPRPSARLSTIQQAKLSTIAERRGLEPRRLSQQLRGELDWIVMKTLEKDRSRRYESASALAADVQHYLSDEPVRACPPSAGYRLRKFFRRNKGSVVAASVVLLCLVVGIIGTSAGMVWALRERNNKDNALTAEKQARDKAMAALRDMTDDIVENQMARGTTLTEENKEFLQKIIKHFEDFAAITAEDTDSRSIRAEGYFRVGRMRHSLGELKEAERAYVDALTLYKQLAADFPTRPELRHDLAKSHISWGVLLKDTGRLKEAEAAWRDALAIQKQLVADFPSRPEFRQSLAVSHNNLGTLLKDTGRLQDAEAAYADALSIQKQLAADFPTRPEFRRALAVSHNNLGLLFADTGRLGDAEAAYADALAIRKQLAADFPTRPEFRWNLAMSHNNLGNLFGAMGRVQDAEVAFAAALAIQKQLAADFPTRPDFRQELARIHFNLGSLLSDNMGRLRDAEAAYDAALAIQKQLAADFPSGPQFRNDLAKSHINRGVLLKDTGRLKEAEAAWRDALAIQKQLAADFPAVPQYRMLVAGSDVNLGSLFKDTDRLQEAEAPYADALAIQKQLAADFPAVPQYRMDLADSHCNLGTLVREKGQPQAALDRYAQAIATVEPVYAQDQQLVRARQILRRAHRCPAATLDQLHRHTEAARDWDRASELDDGPNRFTTRIQRAASLVQTGEHAQATRLADEVAGAKEATGPILYDAGCVFSVASGAVKDDAKLKERYASRAIAVLRQAAQKGYRNVAHMKKDPDLNPLRQRKDLQDLVRELEAKKPALNKAGT